MNLYRTLKYLSLKTTINLSRTLFKKPTNIGLLYSVQFPSTYNSISCSTFKTLDRSISWYPRAPNKAGRDEL